MLVRCIYALFLVLLATPAAAHGRPDPYLGQREYADPYIGAGWSSDGGYRGRDYYALTSPVHLRRNWPFSRVYEHRWSVARELESLARD